MDSCNYTDVLPADEPFLALQLVLHVVTAMAYFTIPLVLIYSIRLSPIFPRKKEFIYFGIVAIFCGVNYMTDIWKYNPHPAMVTMIVKGCHAAMVWLAVVVLNVVCPDLLALKKRKLLLKNKVDELSSSRSLLLREMDSRKLFHKLINEIRSTIDGQSIIKSTIVGLGNLLNLDECSMWFPSQSDQTLRLSNCLKGTVPIGSTLPMHLPLLAEIFVSVMPVRIPLTCPLVKATSGCERCAALDVVAVRVPFRYSACAEYHNRVTTATNYAVMVLVPSSDNIIKFRHDELELVAAVAEQVGVALDHASSLEESIMASNHLRTQNNYLASALRNVDVAFRDSVAWRDGMFNQILNIQYIIPFLSSFMLETTLTPEQRTMIETVLTSSSSLNTLNENARDLSRLEDGSLELSRKIFSLSATINEVVDKIKPMTVVKKLSLLLSLAPDLPAFAVGDQERLQRIILNILANAVKFTKEGEISVTVSVVDPKSFSKWRARSFFMVPTKNHFYLIVEVSDSGCGIDPREILQIFTRFTPRPFNPNQSSGIRGIGLPICKRLLNTMVGDIWVESKGVGNGTTVTFFVKLRKNKGPKPAPVADELCSRSEPSVNS